MENELLNLLRDLVGDFPNGVNSNALEAAREYLAQAESGPTPHEPDKCWSCGKPWSEHRTNRVGHAVCP